MAVYTVLERKEIEDFIAPFGIGPLLSFEGISAGVENTNYFITTDQSDFGSETHTATQQQFVLTIFESIAIDELAFYAELTTLLNAKSLPVPCPLTDTNGECLKSLQGKPALLVPKVAGEHPKHPNTAQCREIGLALADIHRACLDAGTEHKGLRDLDWLVSTAQQLITKLNPEDAKLLLQEMTHFVALRKTEPDLPCAVIHGDLFHDNALYVGDSLSGIIDFNSAGSGYLIKDLAIVVNDWCSNADGSLNHDLSNPLLESYQQQRPFTDDEKTHWNDILRIAAVRFWVSRQLAAIEPEQDHRPGGLLELKDPLEYKRILQQRIQKPEVIN